MMTSVASFHIAARSSSAWLRAGSSVTPLALFLRPTHFAKLGGSGSKFSRMLAAGRDVQACSIPNQVGVLVVLRTFDGLHRPSSLLIQVVEGHLLYAIQCTGVP